MLSYVYCFWVFFLKSPAEAHSTHRQTHGNFSVQGGLPLRTQDLAYFTPLLRKSPRETLTLLECASCQNYNPFASTQSVSWPRILSFLFVRRLPSNPFSGLLSNHCAAVDLSYDCLLPDSTTQPSLPSAYLPTGTRCCTSRKRKRKRKKKWFGRHKLVVSFAVARRVSCSKNSILFTMKLCSAVRSGSFSKYYAKQREMR